MQIARLRKIVGMTGFIETVGRVGYRFRGTERQTEAATLAASLLVAPMLGLDEAGRALAPIFTEDLTTGLARFKSLSLIDSEWSAANVPAASYLLKGAVRCSGRVIQLSLQLIDEATRRIVWSERFGSEARDAAAAVDRIVGGAVPRIESCIRQFELGARADDGEETAEALYRRGSRLARIGRRRKTPLPLLSLTVPSSSRPKTSPSWPLPATPAAIGPRWDGTYHRRIQNGRRPWRGGGCRWAPTMRRPCRCSASGCSAPASRTWDMPSPNVPWR